MPAPAVMGTLIAIGSPPAAGLSPGCSSVTGKAIMSVSAAVAACQKHIHHVMMTPDSQMPATAQHINRLTLLRDCVDI
jgi:hypothetical protein